MHIRKIYSLAITIPNSRVCDTYSNIDDRLMEILKAEYVDKCYGSALITGIVKILERSYGKISFDAPGDVNVNVRFEVECAVIEEGKILDGVKITNIDDITKQIFGMSKNAFFGMDLTAESKNLKKGQIIPVKTLRTSYPIGKTSIVCFGVPVFHFNKTKIVLTKAPNKSFESQLNEITELGKIIEKFKSNKDFTKVSSKLHGAAASKAGATINCSQILKNTKITFPITVLRDNTMELFTGAVKIEESAGTSITTPNEAYAHLLFNIIADMNLMIYMMQNVENFGYDSYSNYWLICDNVEF